MPPDNPPKPTKNLKPVTASRFVQGMLRESFGTWEKLGIHVTPNHFESPIPDTRLLNEETWSKRSALVGIEMRERDQIELLHAFARSWRSEYDLLPLYPCRNQFGYHINNGTFEAVDGEILYCTIRCFKPKKIYEVGCGNSTLLSVQALLKNEKEDGLQRQLVAFDPAPSSFLRNGAPACVKLVESKVEDIPLEQFSELRENDILFLDSSHVLRIGGDVQYAFLEILPRLNKGVLVHVHDIFLPAEYPRKLILERRRFFTEQYLLQAFLAFNRTFEVLWASSFMHLNHPELLEATFKSYEKGTRWPGSFWMKRVAC